MKKKKRFKRIVFQITKGNFWMDIMDIDNYEIIDTTNVLQLNIIQEQFETFKKYICSTGEQIIFFTSELVKSGGFVGAIRLVFGYSVFSLITFDVLTMMDVFECFLHALRLHWVEFQSKFFKADGYAFQKCSYFKAMEENVVLNV
ncbi:unnamed protein product [Paramecium primaurelia]|uniref:V-type proton ATPase subunit a n=1 Tax=Paramecium primaurelia TaxID=5886 RepID=A0A8S1K7B0_PARPR|nr:unnamed protein product [Paramecium primaurelia]